MRDLLVRGNFNEKTLPRCLLDAACGGKLFCPPQVSCTEACLSRPPCSVAKDEPLLRRQLYTEVLIRMHELQRRRLRKVQKLCVERVDQPPLWKLNDRGELCSPGVKPASARVQRKWSSGDLSHKPTQRTSLASNASVDDGSTAKVGGRRQPTKPPSSDDGDFTPGWLLKCTPTGARKRNRMAMSDDDDDRDDFLLGNSEPASRPKRAFTSLSTARQTGHESRPQRPQSSTATSSATSSILDQYLPKKEDQTDSRDPPTVVVVQTSAKQSSSLMYDESIFKSSSSDEEHVLTRPSIRSSSSKSQLSLGGGDKKPRKQQLDLTHERSSPEPRTASQEVENTHAADTDGQAQSKYVCYAMLTAVVYVVNVCLVWRLVVCVGFGLSLLCKVNCKHCVHPRVHMHALSPIPICT